MMMTNLFSIFDPSLSLFSFSWLMCLLVLCVVPFFYWVGNTIIFFFLSFFLLVKKEIDYVMNVSVKGVYSLIGTIFLVVGLYNFLALFPFIFSVTSHMLTTFPLSYTFWVSIILFSWVSSLKYFLAHLIPVGTPFGLMSFMVLVEVLSNLIRPLALTFRLTANMMAGHLLMSLIGGALISLPFTFMLLGGLVQSLLVLMELGVSLIQAYVFSTLLLLYLSESEH
uniref:ATP synthase subunit a n=1 Tax=Thyreophagus entomophagus TaxID=2874286 RepID=A0A977PMA2_9ACAR|nr:ATP synthase F0 subunit 6 [Thyreophagus entomophagus]UXD78883.1 ATP synthase F0 subunit 6 [Thyreophagus entomophagus]